MPFRQKHNAGTLPRLRCVYGSVNEGKNGSLIIEKVIEQVGRVISIKVVVMKSVLICVHSFCLLIPARFGESFLVLLKVFYLGFTQRHGKKSVGECTCPFILSTHAEN